MSYPTLDRAALACAVYAVTQEVLRSIFVPLYPEDCGGTPCWRSVIVLFVQLFWMPVAFFLALRNQAWSMRQWSADCAKHGLQPAAQSIVYIFYVYLLLDILYQELFKPLVILRRLMVIHHVVCLLGNFYGTKLSPLAAVPHYLAGITWLECGSACANAFHIWRGAAFASPVYLIGMSVSNVLAAHAVYCYYARCRDAGGNILARLLVVAVMTVLIYLRQKEVHKLTGIPAF